jgi:hypothetical protein
MWESVLRRCLTKDGASFLNPLRRVSLMIPADHNSSFVYTTVEHCDMMFVLRSIIETQ